MKKFAYSIFILGILLFSISGCDNGDEGTAQGEELKFAGQLTSSSDCKSNLKSALANDLPDTLSCIEYIFDNESNVLKMKHINAGFNCCPGNLYVETSLNSDTIVIQEYESTAECDCNCLFDLEIELTGISAKKYIVKFVEPYVGTNKAQLLFEANLANNTEGKYCVTRKYYPWNCTDPGYDLVGKVTHSSDCKSNLKSALANDLPDTLSCIEYIFDNESNVLKMKHINAGFNCCPGNLYVETSLNSDTIVVKEHETAPLCSCNCLYDLDIELTGVAEKSYFIKVVEPYVNTDGQQLFFEINLKENPGNSYCVIRKNYPWGQSENI